MEGTLFLREVPATACIVVALLGCGTDEGSRTPAGDGHSEECVEMTRESADFDAERDGLTASTLRAGAGEWTIGLTWTTGDRTRVVVESRPLRAPFYVDYEPWNPELHIACPDRFEQETELLLATDDGSLTYEGPGTIEAGMGGQVALTAEVDPRTLVQTGRLESEDWDSATFLLAVGGNGPRGSLSARFDSEKADGQVLVERTLATMQ